MKQDILIPILSTINYFPFNYLALVFAFMYTCFKCFYKLVCHYFVYLVFNIIVFLKVLC